MPAIAIRHLRLQAPLAQAGRTRQQLETALRTELPATGRLIVVRRMRLPAPGRGGGPGQYAAAVRGSWNEALAGARHGGASDAASANCVWFESAAEACLLLLRLLLRGAAADAWFWPLAVPGWAGPPPRRFPESAIGRALDDGDGHLLVAIATLFAAHGRAALFVALLRARATRPAAAGTRHTAPPAAGAAMHGGKPPVPPEIETLLERTRATLPPGLAPIIAALLRHSAAGSRQAATAMACALLEEQAPLLATETGLRETAVHLFLAGIRNPGGAETARVRSGRARAGSAEKATTGTVVRARSHPGPAQAAPRPAAGEPPAPPCFPGSRRATAASAPVRIEQESAAAGLWLLLPALVRLGFRDWLGAQPAAAAADLGRAVLRGIAFHHRVAADDAAMLPLLPPGFCRTDDLPFAATVEGWRRALRHFLRRQVRLSPHALVWRRGWLSGGDDALGVRFPLHSADLRLRRQALDIDPGWVDWLRLSVRYAFRDEVWP